MKTRHWPFLLLATLLTLPPPRARAQESAAPVTPEMRTRSHLPIPFSVSSPEEAQQLLTRHLRHAEDLAALQRMLKDPDFRKLAEDIARDPRKFGVEDQVRELRRDWQWQLRPDFKNPRWQKLVATALERQARRPGADAEISPEQREGWQGLLRRLAEDTDTSNPAESPHLPNSRNGPDDGSRAPEPRPAPPMTPPASQAGQRPGPADQPLARPAPAAPPSPPAGLEGRSQMTQELLKFADRLQNADTSLKHSPALHEFVRNLARYSEPANRPAAESGSRITARLRDRLPQVVESLHLDKLRVDPETWRQARSLVPPAPHVSLHAERLPRVAPTGWAPSRPARAEAGGLGQFVLIVAVALGFGVLLWRLLVWQGARRPAGAAERWRLGPWPVRPNAVRTRAELVQAFDHLALLLLGPVARSWNHMVIAGRLGEDRRDDRRQAAAQLARLYERARYAPPGETLADADLATARRHLCLLAGVHAA